MCHWARDWHRAKLCIRTITRSNRWTLCLLKLSAKQTSVQKTRRQCRISISRLTSIPIREKRKTRMISIDSCCNRTCNNTKAICLSSIQWAYPSRLIMTFLFRGASSRRMKSVQGNTWGSKTLKTSWLSLTRSSVKASTPKYRHQKASLDDNLTPRDQSSLPKHSIPITLRSSTKRWRRGKRRR